MKLSDFFQSSKTTEFHAATIVMMIPSNSSFVKPSGSMLINGSPNSSIVSDIFLVGIVVVIAVIVSKVGSILFHFL